MNIEALQKALLIGLVIGGVGGYFIAQASRRAQGIKGGMVGQVFHYLGASAFTAALPAALIAVFLRGGLVTALVSAFGLTGLALLLLMGYAVFEKPFIQADAGTSGEHGWTEEDARTSGL